MSDRDALIGRELMDQPGADAAELERSLADLRGVNRWLGGTRAMLRRLGPLARAVPERPLRVLDVATGSADLPLLLARWGRERGIEIRITASDLHPGTLQVARERTGGEPWISVEAADALALPWPDRAFHVALCSTALHHFRREDAVVVLRELARVSSAGVVVSDLRRSTAGLLGARLLAATVWRGHPITRHDGPLSVRASFTVPEMRQLAAAAGLGGSVVRREPLFRLSLVHRHPAEAE